MLGSKSDRFPMIRKYVVLLSAIFSNTKKLVTRTLREKCPNTDFFFWSVFGQFSRSGRHHKLPEQLRRFNNLHLKGDYSEKLKSFS